MTTQQIALKVPSLKRLDEPEYIQFRLDPAPRIRKTETKFIRISEVIPREYYACF